MAVSRVFLEFHFGEDVIIDPVLKKQGSEHLSQRGFCDKFRLGSSGTGGTDIFKIKKIFGLVKFERKVFELFRGGIDKGIVFRVVSMELLENGRGAGKGQEVIFPVPGNIAAIDIFIFVKVQFEPPFQLFDLLLRIKAIHLVRVFNVLIPALLLQNNARSVSNQGYKVV